MIGSEGGQRLVATTPIGAVLTSVVAEADLDRAIEAVQLWVLGGSLGCLMFLHQRDELLGGPALGLEVIVV